MRYFLAVTGLVLLAACSNNGNSSADGGSGGGGACTSLCTGAKFTSGTEQKFDNGKVVECMCAGAGTGIAKTACESYCAAFSVSAAKSFLSTETSKDDKCVCDGT